MDGPQNFKGPPSSPPTDMAAFWKSEYEQAIKRMGAMEVDHENFQKVHQEVKSERDILKQQQSVPQPQVDGEVNRLNEIIAQMEAEIKTQLNAKNVLQETYENLLKDRQQLQTQLDDLQNKYDGHGVTISEVSLLNDTIDRMKATNEGHLKTISALKAKQKEYEVKMAKLKADHQEHQKALEAKIAELENELKAPENVRGKEWNALGNKCVVDQRILDKKEKKALQETPPPSTSSSFVPPPTPSSSKFKEYPEWMKQVSIQRFPYIPQLGDLVVYLPLAHKMYLDECKVKEDYAPQSYPTPADFKSQEYAIIEKLDYRLKPYHCALLCLRLQNREIIEVLYHSLEGIADFIIPCELFERSIQQNFKQGDQIEALLGVEWWTGTIQSKRSRQHGYTGCHFNSLCIKWDDEEESVFCSSWDIQPLTLGRSCGVGATSEEIKVFGFIPVRKYDWKIPTGAALDDGNNADSSHYFYKVRHAIHQLSTVPALSIFQFPVNLAVHPDYILKIPYPIDLQTINERSSNMFYRTLPHLKFDIQMIAANAIKFYGENSENAVNSLRLVETLFYVIDDTEPMDASKYFESLLEKSPKELTAYNTDLSLNVASNTTKSRRSSESWNDEPTEELWVSECRNAYERIITEHVKNILRERLNHVFESFTNGEYESPNQFLVALTDVIQTYFSNQKRRTPATREMNAVKTKLENKFKHIILKFNRTVNDNKTNLKRKFKESPEPSPSKKSKAS